MEFVEDTITYTKLPSQGRKMMLLQLESFINQLHSITDPNCRSFAGLPLFGHRFEKTYIPIQDIRYRRYDTQSPHVLCHGDLAWHNLLFDPITFDIKCVLDWEYAGFYPVEVEGQYWRRSGSLGRVNAVERCDLDDVIRVLWSHRELDPPPTPPPVWVPPIAAPLRKLPIRDSDLRQLLQTVHLPPNLTPSVGTVLCEGIDLGRKRLSLNARDMARFLATENHNLVDILARLRTSSDIFQPNKPTSNSVDLMPIRTLNKTLINPFITLAEDLESSGSSFLLLRDQLSVEADITLKLENLETLQALPGTEGWKEETRLRGIMREKKVESRDLADQATKESEIRKWKAIKKFATSLLRLSTAAESILPYLNDHDQEYPSVELDPERAWEEHRVGVLCEGQEESGWSVKLGDIEGIGMLKDQYMREWADKKDERDKQFAKRTKRGEEAVGLLAAEDMSRKSRREKLRSVLSKSDAQGK